jgi:hypothetical protein
MSMPHPSAEDPEREGSQDPGFNGQTVPVFFLDTSIQADRMLERSSVKKQLAASLGEGRLVCSRYVWDQFRRTFLASAVTYHNLILKYDTLGEAHIALGKYLPGVFTTPRLKDRINVIFGNVAQEPITTEAVLDELKYWIEWGFEDLFFDGLEELINETGCQMTAERAEKRGDAYYLSSRCTKASPPDCRIRDFWLARTGDLKKIADWNPDTDPLVESAASKPLGSVRQAAEQLMGQIHDDPTAAVGRVCWVTLSDSVICLECPLEAKVATTNLKDFRPLCNLLGRGLADLSGKVR